MRTVRCVVVMALATVSLMTTPARAQQPAATPATPPKTDSVAALEGPFSKYDWTWLNGNGRQKESVLDSKFFTGEFRADITYIGDFNHPSDHTLVGTTESGRTGEVHVQQLGIGGDFHVGNARGRVMTQFGLYSTINPRNDASPSRGQWKVDEAYRYLSEAYGGYHWNKMHGINVDAGIFMSYIGLYSYYNFDIELNHRYANVPYFAGAGGVTPSGGNTGAPARG